MPPPLRAPSPRSLRAPRRATAPCVALRRGPLLALAALALLPAGAASCGGGPSSDGRPQVVATTAMIGDVASSIASAHLNVVTLMGSGTDPHLFRPKGDDVAALFAADLVLYNGLHLEGRMGATLADLGADGPRVVAVAERVVSGDALAVADDGAPDPHVWMDPELWAGMARGLAPDLAALVPAEAAAIEVEAERYAARLEQLARFTRQCIETIPANRRVLVTAHDAFGYFGRAYGLEVVGLQGISTESEAGVRRIEEVVDLLVDRRVPAVFVESSVSHRAVEALVEGARARGLDVEIGGELFSDAMGAPGTHQGTYIGMIEHNVVTITRALGGEVRGGTFEIWSRIDESARPDRRVAAPDGPVDPVPSLATEEGER